MNLCVATKIEKQESDDLYDFSEEYLNCISNNNWWKKLKELETLILPYYATLNQLQRYNSQLYNVLHYFAFLLHLGYCTDKFNSQIETLSFPNLGKWVTYYYCAWFNEDPMHKKGLGMTHILNKNEELNASDDLNVLDDESSNKLVKTDTNIQTGSNWRNIVSKWINILEDEINEKNNDDDDKSNSNNNDEKLEISIINISNLIYPTRDQNFK
ncbi:hypothetical protein RclHR1_03980030 [Rhizophagus clarus]|uniref:Uncharacterized protein n=1 Tax=Rhizophagus clarus TaxID=94130 RepID=A0A2Z6RFE9_9GLOM|nr:hypothetical protein RclHR1_03980030 [Rhizophagus clarus]